MCPSCGVSLPNGSGVCPNCRASITVRRNEGNQSHYNSSANVLGDVTSGTMKGIIALGIIFFALPIALINPFAVNYFLIKQRRFQSISETGRLLAYKLSFLYTAWFCVYLLVIVNISEADTFNSYLYWLIPSYGIIMLVIALLLVWNTIKEHFFKKEIKIGVLHVLGTISLIIIATIPILGLLIFKAIMTIF